MLPICDKGQGLLAKVDDYKSFLDSIARYGRGVFCITMLEDSKQRHALKMFIYRNSSLFTEIKGTHGDIKLLILSTEGFKHIGVKQKPSRAISSWESLLDIALINAYMVEQKELFSFANKPHLQITIGSKIVGLISNRWGLTKGVAKVDVLLTTEKKRTELLLDDDELAKLSKRESLSINELVSFIELATTPKAFLNLR